MEIKDILKPDEYAGLTQFDQNDKDWINGRIQRRRNGEPGVECIVRGKNGDGDYFKLTPEEIVRQLYAYKLLSEYGYQREQLAFEEPVFFAGKQMIYDKRMDITVFDEEHKSIIMIIEVKRPEINDYKKIWEADFTTPFQQMQSYCNQEHPKIGVLVNGTNPPEFYDAPDYENQLVLDRFPQASEDIQEWKNKRRFTLKQLMQSDRLQNETLKDIILEVEQRFGANDSSDKAFEEIFKLIFTKLFDEKMSGGDADDIASDIRRHHIQLKDIDDSAFRVLEFRATEKDSLDDVYHRINGMFLRAQQLWEGVFPANSTLNMQKATVKSCVKELQNVKLFNSNLEVVDDAFEHLVNQNQKEGMGQYFTPRYVIDMCVKMLNPKPCEKMIDTAAGSCGFPMHTIFHVWKQMNPEAQNLFTTRRRKPEETEYVKNNVFGIDFSEKSVRVGRMLNIIAGDGHTNVMELNSLDFKNWDSDYRDQPEWQSKYGEGFRKLIDLSAHRSAGPEKKYKEFDFDILMANPPFAGDLDNKEQIEQYDLGHKKGDRSEKLQNKVGRDILFIERNLNFLKPGGRMAVVLPQGRFNNSTDKYIREYIMEHCRILAVVGLHGNTFKPHTGTKTSVLLVQKWTDEFCGYPNICPKPSEGEDDDTDYPVFFATMQEPSKDNSGNKIYVTETYVTWVSYKYITIKTITRKSDNTILEEDEFNRIADKNNYEKVQKEILYIRKQDRTFASEEEYSRKKSDFTKRTTYKYRRISDGVILSEDEFRELTKKSGYRIKLETIVMPEEHRAEDNSPRFIKDLFVEQYGPLEDHKKWIQEKCVFVRKGSGTGETKKHISIERWLDLDNDQQKLYKKELLLGENDNPIISNDIYMELPEEAQKFYLAAEEVQETVERVKDTHNHIFVKHDLFNHDPDLENSNEKNPYSQNGIAEAFAKFAYENNLSFAPSKEELEQILHPKNELPF